MRSNAPSGAPTGALVHDSPWAIHRRVVGALIIREMLTRYGRKNLGFLWLFVEPMMFTLIVILIRSATSSIYQGSIPMVAFAMTGWPSVMLWRNMPARLIGAIRSNRSLLHHRQVKVLDIYFSRILLEMLATTTSFATVSFLLFAAGLLTPPEDLLVVTLGWLLLGWFGAGLALIIGSLSERWEVVARLWRPASYVLMPLSGIAFVVDTLPQDLQHLALWLPMLNALEYLRDGWFGSEFHAHYDIGYVIMFNLAMTFAGLAMARQVGMGAEEDE
jgi:ABC-2 type transport system permease protein/capsular polysaccharide transport system permease protein